MQRRTRRMPLDAKVPQHLLLVASSGGHLSQLFALRPWWTSRRRTWVTFAGQHAASLLAGEHVVHAYSPTTRNAPNLIRNTVLAWRVLRRTRPDAIIPSGAGVALPITVLGRLQGAV